MQQLERDVAWNLVPVALLAIVGLGLNFVIGGVWGATGLGVFNQVTTVYMLFAVLGSGGMQFSVLRSVAATPGDVAAITVGALVPGLVLAALTTVLFVALHRPVAHAVDSDAVGTGMLWAAPGMFCFAVNKLLLAVTNGLGRMRAYALYISARYLLIGVALAGAVAVGSPVERLPLLWSIVEGVLLLVLVAEIAIIVPLRQAGAWRHWAREHIGFGRHSVFSTLAFELNSRLDVWMVGVVLSDAAVGVYAMAATIAEGSTQIPVAVQSTVNPRIAEALAANRLAEVDTLVRGTRRWFIPLMIAACALGAVAYPVLIPALAGDAFFAGAWPFAVMMLGIAIVSAWLPFNQLLLMAGRPGWHSVLLAAMIAVNAIGQVILVPLLGLVGAAIAATTAQVAAAVVLRAFVRRLVGVRL